MTGPAPEQAARMRLILELLLGESCCGCRYVQIRQFGSSEDAAAHPAHRNFDLEIEASVGTVPAD